MGERRRSRWEGEGGSRLEGEGGVDALEGVKEEGEIAGVSREGEEEGRKEGRLK